MRISTPRLALAASVGLALAGGIAIAQPAKAPPAGPGEGPPPLDRMQPHGDPAAHAQRLRDQLQLRPDQDPALKAFLDAVAPAPMGGPPAPDDRDEADRTTTPERLDREAAHMARMAEAFQKRAAATRAFYAALTPSQQKAFDALGPGPGGPPMMMGREKPGRHDRPMGGPGPERPPIGKAKPGE